MIKTLSNLLVIALAAGCMSAAVGQPRFYNLVPNWTLEQISQDQTGPASWKSEVKSGKAVWAVEGLEGARCLLLDLSTDGSGSWESDVFPLEANTEYAFSLTYRYDAERVIDGAQAQVVDAKTGDVICSRTLYAMKDWTRAVVPFRTKGAAKAKLRLGGRVGHAVWFDDLVIVPSAAAVHPQEPECGSVVVGRAPVLKWWHEDGAQGRYTVMVASDSQMNRNVSRFAVSRALQLQLPPTFGRGTWFWTVIPSPRPGENEYALMCVSEVRSFEVVSTRGARRDTTPPHLFALRPALDSMAGDSDPVVSGKWLERGGAGIAPKSMVMLLDGRKQNLVKTNAEGFELRTNALAKGRHIARVSVADRAGNRSSEVWQFWVEESVPGVVKLDPNGLLVANGLPFFPIFHYCYSYREANFERDGDYPDAGFNTIINCFNLDRALSQGVKGTQSIAPSSYSGKTPEEIAELHQQAMHDGYAKNPQQFSRWRSDHPAWLGFWIDEEWQPGVVVPALKAVLKMSPNHPSMPVGYGAWFFAQYPPELVDVLSLDAYPLPDLPIASIGDELDRCRKYQTAGQGLHLWGQAFDWYVFQTVYDNLPYFDYQKDYVQNSKLAGHYYRPTLRELLSMAAIGWIHGAQNAGWWGPGAEKIPAVRENLRECARRSRWLAPVLRAQPPRTPLLCRVESGSRYWLGRDYPMIEWIERECFGKRYIILVNVNSAPVSFSITLPGLNGNSTAKVLWEDRLLPVHSGAFHDLVPGVGTTVYEL